MREVDDNEISIPNPQDIRWQQRLANYARALDRLTAAVDLAQTRDLSDLEKQGLIQVFEFTHELAWNVMKDYLLYQGISTITGSRDAVREGFRVGLIHEGERWMEMLTSRNRSSHTYNQAVADEIAEQIIREYHPLFMAFLSTMQHLQNRAEE